MPIGMEEEEKYEESPGNQIYFNAAGQSPESGKKFKNIIVKDPA